MKPLALALVLALALLGTVAAPALTGDAITVLQETRAPGSGRKTTVRHVAVLRNTAPYPVYGLRVTVELAEPSTGSSPTSEPRGGACSSWFRSGAARCSGRSRRRPASASSTGWPSSAPRPGRSSPDHVGRGLTERLPVILRQVMALYGELTGRRHDLLEPYRLEDAEYALVGMGSLVETAMATSDWLRERRGLRVGVLGVTVFRPFPAAEIAAALGGVKALTVTERMDNPLAAGNPLTTEIKAALCDAATARAPKHASR